MKANKRVAAVQDLRRSNAAGTMKDRRTKRDRSRSDQRRNWQKEQGNV